MNKWKQSNDFFLLTYSEKERKSFDRSGIRTHAPEETGALNQRLRPLGHSTSVMTNHNFLRYFLLIDYKIYVDFKINYILMKKACGLSFPESQL